jgi:5'-phosphate synthase pdxT subunit
MIIGVLALQGDFEAHQKALQSCEGVSRLIAVRAASDLDSCDGLVIPGGESTVMSRLCDRYSLWEPLQRCLKNGMGAFGTCAGMILLAQNIEGATRNFTQKTLGALDIDVARNAYGAQLDSFESDVALETDALGSNVSAPHTEQNPPAAFEYSKCFTEPFHAVFIRAPRITRCGPNVRVLARHGGEPVVVSQDRVMACAFHPEIAGDARLHQMWINSLRQHQQSHQQTGALTNPVSSSTVSCTSSNAASHSDDLCNDDSHEERA